MLFRRTLLGIVAFVALVVSGAAAADSFTATAPLNTGRYGAFHALLPDGRVLVAGGFNGANLSSAEIYDPATGTWSAAANGLSAARGFGTTTILANGQVLIAGGGNYDNSGGVTNAEIFDPATNTFTPTGSMHAPRTAAVATLLTNGKVLVVGGMAPDGSTRIASAELYDPGTGTFTQTGSLAEARDAPVIARLGNGKALVTGGGNGGASSIATSELYDPSTGTFSATGSMTIGRDDAVAVVLDNGKVLVASGGNMDQSVGSADLYDPATGTFTASHSTFAPRDFASAVKLPGGKVLLMGGRIDSNNANTGALNTTQIYDPASDTFSSGPAMQSARFYFPAELLSNGNILVAGGYNDAGVVQGAELYTVNDLIFADGFEGP